MIQTGVTVTLDDQTSSSSRRVAESLAEITRRAEELNSSLDPDKLDKTFQKLNELSQKQSKIGQRENQEFAIQGRNVQQTINQISSGATQAGKGDVIGGGGNATLGLLSMAKGAGAAGIIGGVALAAVLGANKFSEVYEGRMGYGMQVAAVMGEYTDNIRQNSELIRNAMKDITHAVSEYGKTFEEGAEAAKAFMIAGGASSNYQRAILDASHYSTAYGADFIKLSQFQGTVERYGGGTLPLDIINGVLQAQGLKGGQYDELLSGMESIFTNALSGGIVKNIVDIAQAQEFFGRAGDQYKGAMGANFIQTLDQSVAAATNLGKQEDVFLYRAASGMRGGNFIETMKLLEEGFSGEGGVDLFKRYMEQLRQFTGGDTETILKLMTSGLGIDYHQAEALYNLSGKAFTEEELRKTLPHDYGRSMESEYTKDLEQIKSYLSSLASNTFDIKAGLIGRFAEPSYDWENETVLSKEEKRYRESQQVYVEENPYTAVDELMIKQAFSYSEGSPEQEAYEKKIENRLKYLHGKGINPVGFYEQYGEEVIHGGTSGVSLQELARMNAYLEQIVNNTGVTADNTGEDIEVSVPSEFQHTGSYYMQRK
jgi:hypothetical protein